MVEFHCRRKQKDGTPIIKDVEIEDYAERILRDYNPRYVDEPWELDALKFLEYYLGAIVEFMDIYCEEDEQIAGATVFNDENIRVFDRENLCTRMVPVNRDTILIDNSTMEEGREEFARFTEFHEGGHFCMHKGVFRNTDGQMNIFEFIPEQTGRNVVCCRKSELEGGRRTSLETPEDWREHQANTFAAAIAMPRRTFDRIATETILKMGCPEGVYLLPTLRETDYDPCYDSLAAYLGRMFRVSKSAAKVQLRKHKLVVTSWEAMQMRVFA